MMANPKINVFVCLKDFAWVLFNRTWMVNSGPLHFGQDCSAAAFARFACEKNPGLDKKSSIDEVVNLPSLLLEAVLQSQCAAAAT